MRMDIEVGLYILHKKTSQKNEIDLLQLKEKNL